MAAAAAAAEAAAVAAALEAEERLWLDGFGDEPDADEAEWDDALWEEGDGEVTLRASVWEEPADDETEAASAGAGAGAGDGEGNGSAVTGSEELDDEEEDSADEAEPAVGVRRRFELRYTLTRPATRERLCSAGDVLRDAAEKEGEAAGAVSVIVGGVIHDRSQRYASHYTVEYLMVSEARLAEAVRLLPARMPVRRPAAPASRKAVCSLSRPSAAVCPAAGVLVRGQLSWFESRVRVCMRSGR